MLGINGLMLSWKNRILQISNMSKFLQKLRLDYSIEMASMQLSPLKNFSQKISQKKQVLAFYSNYFSKNAKPYFLKSSLKC